MATPSRYGALDSLEVGGGLRICVSTWGNPRAWRYARYVYSDSGASSRGFSTLHLLLEGVKCDRIYIVGLDTLADLQNLSSYEGVERGASRCIEDYLCLEPGYRDRVEIVVAPGIMRKQVGGYTEHFRADLRSTGLKILTELYLDIVDRVARRERQRIELVLDVSHGINYLPVISREVVEELAASLSTSMGEPVRLEIYNADPFPDIEDQRMRMALTRSGSNPCRPSGDLDEHSIPTLAFNRLTRSDFEPWSITGFMRYRRDTRLLSEVRDCDLDDGAVRNLVEVSKRISAAYRVGAVIELVKLVVDSGDVDEVIRQVLLKVVSCWRRSARIDVDGRSMVLTTRKFLEGVRILIHTHSIVVGVKSILDAAGAREATVRLSIVKMVRDRLLGGSVTTSSLVDYEISKLKHRASSSEFKLYRDVLWREREDVEYRDVCSQEEPGEEDVRNFIAHAGFHSHIIEARRVGDDVEVRIRGDCSRVVDRILMRIADRYSASG